MERIEDRTGKGIVAAGALGALAASLFMLLAGRLVGEPLGGAVGFLGGVLGLRGAAAAVAGGIALTSMAFVWALVYERIGDRLPSLGGWRGPAYGAAVWLISTVILWPLLSLLRPDTITPGLFGLGLGGLKASVLSLLAHGLYGSVIARSLQPSP